MPKIGGSPGRRELNYPQVGSYKELVASYPVIDNIDKIILVRYAQRIWPFKKKAGLYRSDGIRWDRLGKVSVSREELDLLKKEIYELKRKINGKNSCK